ncbi:MAG: hypothetical protein FWD43_02930, partial [Coriobacteriia bacterium]|nr:hypothetical protein [Coriobacteriia bacterium]
ALADGAFTYIGTPDLSMEANPLVAYFGFGWGALFIANVIGISFQIVFAYYAFIGYKSPLLPYKGFKEFFSMLYYKRPDKFKWSFYKFPKNWKPVLAMSGYALAIAPLIARAVVVFQWVLVLTDAPMLVAYNSFRSLFPFTRFDVFLACIVVIALLIVWQYREYRINKKRILSVEQTQ